MDSVTTDVVSVLQAIDPLLERVQLLAPEPAAAAAMAMRQEAAAICNDLVFYAIQGPQEGEPPWHGFATRVTMLHELRATFFLEARAQLMTAPRPQG
ncbi:hypothetical protein [Streptomyces tendae]